MSTIREYDSDTLLQDAEHFLYWPDLGDDTILVPAQEWMFDGFPFSANQYGIYLDLGKIIGNLFGSLGEMQAPKHIDTNIFQTLSSPTLLINSSENQISLWHPAMKGLLPPINIDMNSKWAGIEKTTFGRILLPSLERVIHRFEELTTGTSRNPLESMGLDPIIWKSELEKYMSNLARTAPPKKVL